MTKFVSCDTSTNNSALTLFIDGQYKEHVLISKAKIYDTYQRMNAMMKGIYEQLEKWQPDTLWIEYPEGRGGNIATHGKLCEILGAVRMWCLTHSCEYNEITPSEWRKYAGIKQGKLRRDALKQASIDYIEKKLGINEGDDVADSIALGYAVINYFN